jgi:hypothetical protein
MHGMRPCYGVDARANVMDHQSKDVAWVVKDRAGTPRCIPVTGKYAGRLLATDERQVVNPWSEDVKGYSFRPESTEHMPDSWLARGMTRG